MPPTSASPNASTTIGTPTTQKFSVSISGPSSVYKGCTATYTLHHSGPQPASISWEGNGSGNTITYRFNSSTTVAVTVTAVDGQRASDTISVQVIDPGVTQVGCSGRPSR